MEGFQLLSEADDSYHIQHKNGKSFTVEKKGLSKKAHEAIKKMSCGGNVQMKADGGEIDSALQFDPTQVPEVPSPNQQRYAALTDFYQKGSPGVSQQDREAAVLQQIQQENNKQNAAKQADQQYQQQAAETKQKIESQKASLGLPNSSPPTAPEPVSPQTATAQAPVDPLIQKGQSTEGILNQQEQDVNQYQKTLADAGANSQKAWQDFETQRAQSKTPEQIQQEYAARDNELMKHYMDQQIDPNRYVHNMSTGSKILSGIGLALSGMGAGPNGKNLAFEHITNAINNDIESQKTDQSKSMNLWRMNREHMKDEQAATLATQNQLLTGVQAKIAMAGGTTQNAEARLKASQMVSQIEAQKTQNRMQLALMTGQGGGSSQADPSQLVLQMVQNPEHQKQIFAEIDNAKTIAQNRDKILSSFDEASKDNTVMRTGAGFLREPGASKKLKQGILPLFKDIDSTVRQAAMDETFHNVVPAPGDAEATVKQKRAALENWLDSKADGSMAKGYGINLHNFASTSPDPVMRLNPQQKSFVAWAKANPSDPKSAIVLKKLGVK